MALAPSPPSGDDRGPSLIRVAVAMNALAIFAVILRFFTRGYIVRTFGLDDFFIALATMLGAAMTAMTILQVESGQGRHVRELTDEQMMRSMLFMWIDMLIYYLANWAVKMSILALYHRISHGTKGLPFIMNAKAIYTMAACITVFTVGIMFFTIVSCDPVAMPWDRDSIPTGCHSVREFNMAQGSINVFTDLILLMFPIPIVRALQFDRRQQVALLIIFGIGVVPLIASIRRLCELSMPNEKGSWLTADMTWRLAFVPLWSHVEVEVGIIAASLSSLSPLLRRWWSGFGTERPKSPSQISSLTDSFEWCSKLPSGSGRSSIEYGNVKTSRGVFDGDFAVGKSVDIEKGAVAEAQGSVNATTGQDAKERPKEVHFCLARDVSVRVERLEQTSTYI